MFSLLIQKSPDLDILGSRIFFKNTVYIGQTNGDILLPENLGKKTIKFEILLNQAGDCTTHCTYVHKEPVILVNNKLLTGTQIVNKGDVIKIGDTVIKIVDLAYDQNDHYAKFITKKKEEVAQTNFVAKEIISLLDKELEKLDV